MEDDIFKDILTEELPDEEEPDIIIPGEPKPKKKKKPKPEPKVEPRPKNLPGKYKDRIIKPKAIRRFLKEKNIKVDVRPSFFDELDKEVKFLILKARKRSEKGNRKSLRGRDV